MRKILKITGLAVTILLLFNCNRKIVTGDHEKIRSRTFDTASFDYLFIEGIKLKLLGSSGEAVKFFEKCAEINPYNDAVYYQIAQIVLNSGKLEEGRKYLGKSLAIDPLNKWYHIMMAGTYYQTGNIDSALYYYEKASLLQPSREDIMLNLGNLYSENRQYDKAIEIFEAFDRKYGINDKSTISAVQNYIKSGDFVNAENKLLKLIDESPDNILYNGLIAEVYRLSGRKDEAMDVYNNLIRNNPKNPDIVVALADFLLNEKKFDDLLILMDSFLINDDVPRESKMSLLSRMIGEQELIKEHGDELQVKLMVMEAEFENDDIVVLLRPELLENLHLYDEAELLLQEILRKNQLNYYAAEKLLLLYFDTKQYNKLMASGKEVSTRFNRSFLAKALYAYGASESGKQ